MLLIIIWTYFVLRSFYFTIYLKFEPVDRESDDKKEVIEETEMENNTTTTHGCAGSSVSEGGHKKFD